MRYRETASHLTIQNDSRRRYRRMLRLIPRGDPGKECLRVWARKLALNARPNDPKLQSYHQEATKAAGSGFSSSPPHPRSKGRKGKRSVDADGFAPPKQLVRKSFFGLHPPPPSAPSVEGAFLEGTGEEEWSSRSRDSPKMKSRCLSLKPASRRFLFHRKVIGGNLSPLPKLKAPLPFQSQMSGRFLKVTVSDEVEYSRTLSRWLETTGVEFKSFMLKTGPPGQGIRPAPGKDASINAGLLKGLFEVIEESPSIDKQTFAGRLKTPFAPARHLRT
ncbi:hypothetical protein TNCV_902771 [Trichonephila clavipes]|nr:hypothetical protein TNCV_902771 [Trichonephila clavipes]